MENVKKKTGFLTEKFNFPGSQDKFIVCLTFTEEVALWSWEYTSFIDQAGNVWLIKGIVFRNPIMDIGNHVSQHGDYFYDVVVQQKYGTNVEPVIGEIILEI
jgi:hypothetical protein